MNDKDLMKKLSMMTNEEIEQEAKRLINDGIPKELIKPVGEWVYDTTIAGMRYYRCSICSTGYNTIANECEVNWWRFCPRCGSKMFTKEEDK